MPASPIQPQHLHREATAAGTGAIGSGEPRLPTRAGSRYDNRITLQKLEVLCLVVELGGVTRAADQLWVAQSVVSGHLRSLQERLGVKILYREGQQMKLTKAGEQVYEWASETLARTRDLMHSLDDSVGGPLAVGASLTTGSYLLPPILADFRRTWPRAVITMSVTDPVMTYDMVERGECDLGIIISEAGHEHPHVRSEVIGQVEIILVTGARALPGVTSMSVSELSELALVAPFAGTTARDAIDRQLAEYGAAPQNVVMELGHPEAMKRVIQNGADACLLFRNCVEDELRAGTLRQIPLIDARLSLPVLCVEHAERPSMVIQAELIEQTRSYLAGQCSTNCE